MRSGDGYKFGWECFFQLYMNIGKVTNNQAELLALWGILHFVNHRGIVLDHILGDSKVIIDWTLKHRSFQSIILHHWIQRVHGLLDSYPSLNIAHVYREYNTLADILSKHAIGLRLGLIYLKEFALDP